MLKLVCKLDGCSEFSLFVTFGRNTLEEKKMQIWHWPIL